MKIQNLLSGILKFTLTLGVFLFLINFNNSFAQQNENVKHKQKTDTTLMMRREMIHSRSHLVMPFNMNKVTHYFIDKQNGGILRIKAKNPEDTLQINLIREHLKKEHDLFSKGNFEDPKTLHGMEMPGLNTLTTSRNKYKVEYKELSEGAQLTFTSKDSTVIRAFHVWFAAQLRDHGKDASSKDEINNKK